VNDRHTVLHLIETGGPGGAETIFRDMVTGLPPGRWRCVPVIPVEDWLHQALAAKGVTPILLPAGGNGRLRTLVGLRRIMRENEIDLVHAHLLGSGVYASLAALPQHTPVVCTLHGLPDLSGADPLLSLKIRILSRRGNRIVFVSNALRDAVLSRHPLPRERVTVVHNGIELMPLDLDGSEREQLGASPEDFLVGAVGNVRPAKDYPTLLRAVAIARDRGCPMRAVVLGEGSGQLRDDLVKLRSRLGLDQAVSFLGFRWDALRFLSAFDAFALSSSTEGFSLSTLEALWIGTPVVATACGGPEEIVRHGVTGLLVPPRDPEALADALFRLYRESGLARRLATTGMRDVRRRFSRARMIEAYETIYDAAIRHRLR
jgi:glycosyltransferase involved in cell wall biosynthesis